MCSPFSLDISFPNVQNKTIKTHILIESCETKNETNRL